MNNISGIAVSKGIRIAKVYKIEEINLNFSSRKIVSTEEEKERFQNGLNLSVDQLDEIKNLAKGKLSNEELEVFEAHKLILLDPEIKTQVENKILNESKDCATAAKEVTDQMISMFENMDNDYFKERAADVADVRKRLIANLLELKLPEISTIKEEVIIVANDLTPSETSQLNKNYTLGFATNIGGKTSHAAIMARSMEIPAIVGMGNILENVEDGQTLILDAIKGEVIIDPDEKTLEEAKQKIKKYAEEQEVIKAYKGKKTETTDNKHFELVANIGTPNDLEGVIENDAEGVGLYRTEFLYMDSNELPSEEVQFEAYKKVLETMENKPVVVRTLDIGGDKELSYLKFPEEMNPFLGYRAIRLCLDRDDIFRVQLRALLRASVYGNLKIMFPMIATLGEFREAKKILFEEKDKLISEGIEVSNDIELGIMVEIPSTAMMADTFAKEVDFFSIGTNDLIQYTMACDRMSDKISYLYQPYNPAILRMVKKVVEAANAEGKWAGMCGEMASDPVAITILVGLGLHEFSMSAPAILPSRMQINNLSQKEISKHVDTILNLTTADEVEEYVKKHLM